MDQAWTSGIIGTNKACAIDTVAWLNADLDPRSVRDAREHESDARARLRDDLLTRLSAHPDHRMRSVSWSGSETIDAAEIELGAARGRARTKITDSRLLTEIADRAL
jgi:hypothetical protein